MNRHELQTLLDLLERFHNIQVESDNKTVAKAKEEVWKQKLALHAEENQAKVRFVITYVKAIMHSK